MRRHILALSALALTGVSALAALRAPAWPEAFAPPPEPLSCAGSPTFETMVVRDAAPGTAHVPGAVALRDGGLRAIWYEGSRELAPDVAIRTATFAQGRWSPPRIIIDAPAASRALGRYVRKLGNAVIYRDSRGDLVLLFATIAIGGWSAASLNLMRSADEGETWSAPQRLVTTPLFDFSSLLRSPPIAMSDGAVLLPAYDELWHPYPQTIVLAANGRPIGRRRIGSQRRALQPSIVRFDRHSARAYMRAQRGNALASDTADGGRSWSESSPIDIPSRDNPVAAQQIAGDHLLMIYNARGGPRGETGPLSFALSADRGKIWRLIHDVRDPRGEARYPWLMAGPDGHYHLFYTQTVNPGSEIVHVRFNRDWLAAQGGPPC